MYGYSIKDIADNFGKSRQLYEILLKRAVKKIVKLNNDEWEKWSGGRLDDE
jgi:predicted DNA binding protein